MEACLDSHCPEMLIHGLLLPETPPPHCSHCFFLVLFLKIDTGPCVIPDWPQTRYVAKADSTPVPPASTSSMLGPQVCAIMGMSVFLP